MTAPARQIARPSARKPAPPLDEFTSGIPHVHMAPPASWPPDYAEDDDPVPAAARPMFTACESILLASLLIAGALGLWIGWPS